MARGALSAPTGKVTSMPLDQPEFDEPPGLAAEVRRLVAEAGTRRAMPRRCHVGTPGGERLTLPDLEVPDPGLARDLVVRALDGLAEPGTACVWITRFGPAAPDDGDRFWHAAAVAGFARHGLPPRSSWLVHRTGYVQIPPAA
jgi:hypothetical protein